MASRVGTWVLYPEMPVEIEVLSATLSALSKAGIKGVLTDEEPVALRLHIPLGDEEEAR